MTDSIPRISAVLITWNRRETLLGTLRHYAACPDIGEVIVVDNGSDDGTARAVAENFPGIGLIHLDANVGIAAYAAGFKRARGRYCYIADDDAWPDPAGLRAAAAHLDLHAGLALAAFNACHPGTGTSEWASVPDADRPHDDWCNAIGCGMLIRREVLDAVGGYADAFFLYYNDLDLALRVLGHGRSIAYDPAWVAWHARAPQGRDSARTMFFATRNLLWVGRMHFRGWRRWGVQANGLLGILRRCLRNGQVAACLRGVAAGLWHVAPPCPFPAGTQPDAPGTRRFLRRHCLPLRLLAWLRPERA